MPISHNELVACLVVGSCDGVEQVGPRRDGSRASGQRCGQMVVSLAGQLRGGARWISSADRRHGCCGVIEGATLRSCSVCSKQRAKAVGWWSGNGIEMR